jgi:hypothetical protein
MSIPLGSIRKIHNFRSKLVNLDLVEQQVSSRPTNSLVDLLTVYAVDQIVDCLFSDIRISSNVGVNQPLQVKGKEIYCQCGAADCRGRLL